MNTTLNTSDELNGNATFKIPPNFPVHIHGIILTVSTVGFVGNILTIIILLQREMKSFSVLLSCLFMSDSLFTGTYVVGAIIFILGYDIGLAREILRTCAEFSLGISNGFASLASSERSIAVIKALWHRRMWKKKYTLIGIAAVVVVNITLETVRRIDFALQIIVYIRVLEHVLRRYIPFMFIMTGNIMMAIGMYTSMKQRQTIAATAKNDMNITRPMFALIMTYFVCTAPGSIMVLIFDIGLRSPANFDNEIIFMVTIMLEVINASVNCFLYALVNRQYRTDVANLLCCRGKKYQPKKQIVAAVAKSYNITNSID